MRSFQAGDFASIVRQRHTRNVLCRHRHSGARASFLRHLSTDAEIAGRISPQRFHDSVIFAEDGGSRSTRSSPSRARPSLQGSSVRHEGLSFFVRRRGDFCSTSFAALSGATTCWVLESLWQERSIAAAPAISPFSSTTSGTTGPPKGACTPTQRSHQMRHANDFFRRGRTKTG